MIKKHRQICHRADSTMLLSVYSLQKLFSKVWDAVAKDVVGMLHVVATLTDFLHDLVGCLFRVGLPIASHHTAKDWGGEAGAVGVGDGAIHVHHGAVFTLRHHIGFDASIGRIAQG